MDFRIIKRGNIKGNKAACLANQGNHPWPAGSCSVRIPGFIGCPVKVLQSSPLLLADTGTFLKSVQHGAGTTTVMFMNLWSLETTSNEALLCAIDWMHGQMRDCSGLVTPMFSRSTFVKTFACVLLRNTRNGWQQQVEAPACGKLWGGLSVKSLFWIGFFTATRKGKQQRALCCSLGFQVDNLCNFLVFRLSVQ